MTLPTATPMGRTPTRSLARPVARPLAFALAAAVSACATPRAPTPSPGTALSGEDPRIEVRRAVDDVFLGMRQADSAMVRARFAPTARFALKSPDGGEVQARPVDGWIAAIAGSRGQWDERIYDVVVQVDDDVAQVWAPYTFYREGRLSHCGTNAVELLRVEGRWLVTQISDSRRTEGCPDPLRG